MGFPVQPCAPEQCLSRRGTARTRRSFVPVVQRALVATLAVDELHDQCSYMGAAKAQLADVVYW